MVLQIVDNGSILPEGLAVGPDGNLLVVESGTGRLLSIDLAIGDVSTMARDLDIGVKAIPGTPPTYIFNDVAVSSSGVIYVTGDVSNVLYRIDSNS